MRVGGGKLEAGIAASAGQPPNAYLDFQARLKEGLALYAQGQYAGKERWAANAGLQWIW